MNCDDEQRNVRFRRRHRLADIKNLVSCIYELGQQTVRTWRDRSPTFRS